MNNPEGKVELKIDDVVYRGKGLARLDGKVIFVPGVLPDEVVKVKITYHGKNFSEARLLEIIKASPLRIKPVCPLVPGADSRQNTICPGCIYQHAEYSAEVDFKQKQFINLLERMGGVDPAVCLPAVPSPNFMGYRNKIVLHGAVNRETPSLGYFSEDNRTVVDVPSCPLARQEINDLLGRTRADNNFARTVTDHLTATFRFTEKDGALMWVGQHNEDNPWLTESSVLGDVKVPRGSFFQVNVTVADLIILYVIGLIKQVNPGFIIDLYCGVGMFTLAAAKAGVKNIFGVDMDPNAISAAEQNVKNRQIKNIEFKSTTAQKGLKWAFGKVDKRKTTVIVDPPRRGLEKQVVERLATMQPAGIIYISCAADTMARDVKQLKTAGYSVRSTRLFDMFPRTSYFESVTWLVQ
ncbi:MAG: class I SAM-dependent RNA methyltransferase [Kiritimatiellae bacterium]|nr:class I SAM-dependent RNA methyltransferase [Kiritimatiellia bacterium]MDD5519349.1 class I SAM-dependent RNA methyltransferase [Kiritimatiellia bacterium]